MRHDQIALQLYTVRHLLAEDLSGTLEAVADAGYRFVELAGLPDLPAADLAARLNAADLRPVAAHEGIERLRADVSAVAGRLTRIECPRVIVPWMPEEDRRDADAVRRFAAELDGFGEELEAHGLRIGYHNHAFEFVPLDGTTVWDVLVAELSPRVELELDVYWAAVGGRDPAATIRGTDGRIRLLHMKDRAASDDPHDAPVGDGVLDMPDIIDAARSSGVEWYVVEQDEPADALSDIDRSLRHLTRLAT